MMLTRADLQKIAIPRPVGSTGYYAVRDILQQYMARAGLAPYNGKGFLLPYNAPGFLDFANLVGILPGDDQDAPAIVIGAHYDTCGMTPGADDNAAAVWILLWVVSKLRQRELRRSVILALFDAEEPPFFITPSMGSIRFYESQLKHEVHCAIILDLAGHDIPVPEIKDVVFVTGAESHPTFGPVISSLVIDPRIRLVPALNEYVGDMSDHHVFRTHEVPYLFFSCGRWEHYHMPTDTPEKLNYDKMEGLAASLRNLIVECDLADFQRGEPMVDTTALEARSMNAAFEDLLQAKGLRPLKDREDIDRVAAMFMRQFGL